MDSRTKRDGKAIDEVGHYNPKPDPPIIELDEEKIKYHLKNGVVPTETVKAIFKKKGIYV